MGKKKAATTTTNQPALKIGSRVRCTDDGITGRITWANGVSVKIKWDDGEQVTWRRDSLPGRPIAIIDADETASDEQPAGAPVAEQVEQAAAVPEQITPTEQPASEAEAAPEQADVTEPQATESATTVSPEQPAETSASEPVPPASEQAAPQQTEGRTPARGIDTPATTATAKPKRERKAKAPTEPKEKKLSALDAAYRVLAESGQAMTCKEMIGAMAIKGYWTSPGGATPDATLCSAILREIKVKGDQSRFVKTAPGRFAARPTA